MLVAGAGGVTSPVRGVRRGPDVGPRVEAATGGLREAVDRGPGFHATWVMLRRALPTRLRCTRGVQSRLTPPQEDQHRAIPIRDVRHRALAGPSTRRLGLEPVPRRVQLGRSATFTFWDVIWSMVAFFFWFMLIWIFISIFADIFRRNDLSGGWKAIWIIVIFIIPFFGALIYIISRPKVTAQDVQMMTQADAAQKAAAGVSTGRPDREAQPAQGVGRDHRSRVRGAQEEGDGGLIMGIGPVEYLVVAFPGQPVQRRGRAGAAGPDRLRHDPRASTSRS